MVYLTEKERIDILIMVGYGDRKRTQQEVCRLFNETYRNRHINQSCVAKIVKKYAETGHVKTKPKTGRRKSVTIGNTALNVLLAVQELPHSSTRDLRRDFDISQTSVCRLLKKEKYHPYKVTLVQQLDYEDFDRRMEYCERIMARCLENPNFLPNVLFSNEATFMLNGRVNRHNCRYWSEDNPHWMLESHTQRPLKLNVWTSIIGNFIIGPFFIDGNLTTARYLDMLTDSVIPAIQGTNIEFNQVWFQQDGAPAHFGRPILNFVNNTFPNRWIGRRGTTEWPARSPDLTPCDFFLWGHLSSDCR